MVGGTFGVMLVGGFETRPDFWRVLRHSRLACLRIRLAEPPVLTYCSSKPTYG
jgi:hypothetical protein